MMEPLFGNTTTEWASLDLKVVGNQAERRGSGRFGAAEAFRRVLRRCFAPRPSHI
jgi:hypothetical protein